MIAHNDLLLELVLRREEERPFERHWLPLLERAASPSSAAGSSPG